MKLLLASIILILLFACRQKIKFKKNETVCIYIAGCDSIFYCEDEKLNSENLHGSRKDDSVFINNLIENISSASNNILVKPFGGSCGGIGETMMNLIKIFKRNNLNYAVWHPNSLEENFFDDISFLDLYSKINPDGSPNSSHKLGLPQFLRVSFEGKPLLMFVITKNDKIYYQYDTTIIYKNLIRIKPSSSEAVLKIISEIETKYKTDFSKGNIFIDGHSNETFLTFKKIEGALAQKKYFKFHSSFSQN